MFELLLVITRMCIYDLMLYNDGNLHSIGWMQYYAMQGTLCDIMNQ